jgi:putative membrane protein
VKASRKIKRTAYTLGLAGAALLTVLIARQGAGDVMAALLSVGWGLVVICVLHVAKTLADTAGWLAVIPRGDRLRVNTALWIHWLGESVSDLLPTARIGGDIVIARLAAEEGMPPVTAIASMLVDVTACVFTKILYIIAGLVVLIWGTGQLSMVGPGITTVVIGLLAISAFYGLQRFGIFRMGTAVTSRLAHSTTWQSLKQNGEALDQTVRRFYGRRRGIVVCCGFAAVSWVLSAAEIWVALLALGANSSFVDALILESVAQAVRGALFVVPGALGVQESGYLIIGGILGISGEAALALSLIRRVRELVLGLPGLVVWQLIEGGRLWRIQSIRDGHPLSQTRGYR